MASQDANQSRSNPTTPAGGKEEQLLVRGVIGSWLVQIVFVITGFVLPRLIDDQLGQERLGLWDFGWTFVAYLTLLQGGMNSSIARYVARYTGLTQWTELSGFLKTALLALLGCSGLALLITLATVALLPMLLADSLGQHVSEARGVVFFLGLAVCMQFPQAVFGGTIAGCRRYDLLNSIMAAGHLLQVVGIIAAISLGYDLTIAAIAVLFGDLAMWIGKAFFAYRLCPRMGLTRAKVTRQHLRDVVVFGGKTQLSVLSKLAAYQTSSLLVLGYLGPAMLALYARPRSLVLHAQKILRRLAIVLEPSVANLQAKDDKKNLARLYLEGTRFSAYIALPLVFILVIMGGPIMRLWMGEGYENPLLITILAVGHLPSLVQRVTFSVLLGLGRHGRVALMDLAAGITSIGLTVLFLGVFSWGVVGAALALVGPIFLVNALLIPAYGCRAVGVPLHGYIKRSFVGPVVASLPFALLLVAARGLFADSEAGALLFGLASGGLWLSIWYWLYVLPETLKTKIASLPRVNFGFWGFGRQGPRVATRGLEGGGVGLEQDSSDNVATNQPSGKTAD